MSFGALADPQLLGPAAVVLVVLLVLYLTFSGFAMVGVSAGETFVLLFLAPFVAGLNLPIWTWNETIIAVNAAGLLIPLGLTFRFVGDERAPWIRATIGVGVVTYVAYRWAEYVPGEGILVPAIPIALAASVVGISVGGRSFKRWGPLTFVSGAIGTLVGADLFNLEGIVTGAEAPPAAVIGGAGTLDAIYLCGVIAVAGSIVAAVVTRVLTPGR